MKRQRQAGGCSPEENFIVTIFIVIHFYNFVKEMKKEAPRSEALSLESEETGVPAGNPVSWPSVTRTL